ncbi:hypothetical protein V496_00750 [Pseudogymnoascus sp. VKM F-4515 (FW-2607)]|nr:hypothetical protein V496_00750 [Pseudogymnoascus sp. VKM F-4515 (FW-2607)]
MEDGDRKSIFRSLMPSKFISSNPKKAPNDADDKSKSTTPMDAYSRRRQQVKRAQMNHRHKKENYVFALEEEVKRLRQLVAQHQSLGDIQSEKQPLRETLVAHEIAAPRPNVEHTPSAGLVSVPDFVQISLLAGPGPGQHLEPSMPSSIQGPSTFPFPPPGKVHIVPTSALADLGYGSNEALVSRTRTGEGASDVNLEAFDFVMRLEQSCFAHVHTQDGSLEAPGHALSLQSASMAYAPPHCAPGTSWNVPVGEMQQLLDLSAMLPLTGELTPIQAWSHLMSHAGSSRLTRETLLKMTMRLSQEVRCYGFGAVIEEKVFRTVLDIFLHMD